MKKIYIVSGCFRSGTSLAGKWLSSLGVIFPGDCKTSYSKNGGGYMESQNISKAIGFYDLSDDIKFNYSFFSIRLKRIFSKIGMYYLKKGLVADINGCKMYSNCHRVQELGYEPIIIGVKRNIKDLIKSYYKHKDFNKRLRPKDIVKHKKDIDLDNELYLTHYKGTIIDFEKVIVREKQDIDTNIANLLNLKEDYVYQKRLEVLNLKQ